MCGVLNGLVKALRLTFQIDTLNEERTSELVIVKNRHSPHRVAVITAGVDYGLAPVSGLLCRMEASFVGATPAFAVRWLKVPMSDLALPVGDEQLESELREVTLTDAIEIWRHFDEWGTPVLEEIISR